MNPTDDPGPAPSRATRRAARRAVRLGRRGATALIAGGLIVGGTAGTYAMTQAVPVGTSVSPSASGTPESGHGGRHGPGPNPADRADDLAQAAGVIGISSAQLQTELGAGKTIAAVAAEHHVAVTSVIAKLVTDENSEIDARVKSGTLSAERAARMKATTQQRVTDMVNGVHPARGRGHGLNSEDQQVVASALGISTTVLQTELAAGKTIAAIAGEHGVSVTTVITAWVNSENAEIDQRVSSGHLTAAQAAQMKAHTQQRITDAVNGTVAPRLRGGPGAAPTQRTTTTGVTS